MFNQPTGLFVLCLCEMWERFSYYGMRAILMLYMTEAMGLSHERAATVYGWYTGLVYLTPIVGGMIADRYVGQQRAILMGGALMALGHFFLMLPSNAYFFFSLCLIIVGNGLFKPNIAVLVGELFLPGDGRRDGGFSLFYVGINMGAFLAPLICGTLGQKVGWHYGFGAAGIGMLVGLSIFWLGRERLGGRGTRPPARSTASLGGIASRSWGLTAGERRRLLALLLLAVFGNLVWWSAFEQAGSSLALFAESAVDLRVAGGRWALPSSWFQSANPFFIALMAPFFAGLWLRLARQQREPSTASKFALALVFLAAGFSVMTVAGRHVDLGSQVGMGWLLAAYFFNTCGELCLSPVGLSAVTKLSPKRHASAVMGFWYSSIALANIIGGQFAGLYDALPKAQFFFVPVSLALLSAICLLRLRGPLGRLVAET